MKKILVFAILVALTCVAFSYQALKPVDVTTAVSSGTVLYWTGQKYDEAIASGSKVHTSDGSTTAVTTGDTNLIYPSVSVTFSATSVAYTVAYSTGILTFTSAPASDTVATITYDYFVNTAPCAILMEDVDLGQSPAYALVFLGGEIYETQIFDTLPDIDVLERLAMYGIYVIPVD